MFLITGKTEVKKMAPAAGTSEDFFAPQIVSDQEDLSSKVANLATFTQDKKAGSNGNFWCLHLENDT